MPKQKVLVFTTSYAPFIGGAEIAIQEITRRLRDRFDFFIVTSRFRRDLPRREILPEGTVIRIGFGNRFDKWLLPFFVLWGVPSISTSAGPTAVGSKTKVAEVILLGVDVSQGALVAAILKLLCPKAFFIFNIQYGYGNERIKKGRLGLINLALRFILNKADYVTAISNYLLDLARKYGYRGLAEVTPNGVDIQKFSVRGGAAFGGKNLKNKVIITTSRLVLKNGIDILIRAVAEVKKTLPEIRCHILGDGPERQKLEKLTKDLNLEKKIKFFGHVPYNEIPQYLHEADIFVRPSRSEGMGNSFIEALAAGLPIIGTPVEGILDIIEDGKTGFFAKVSDFQDLANKIIFVLNNRQLADFTVKNGTVMISEKFSWDKIAESYRAIFSKSSVTRKKFKIVIATPLYPPDIGGPATYSKLLADELPKSGIKAEIASFGSVRRLPKIIRHAVYFLKILNLGRRADVIFAQDPVSVGFPAAIAAKILRKKFLLKVVGDYAWEQGTQRFGVKALLDEFLNKKYGFGVELLRKIQKFTANQATFIIVPSFYLKKIVMAWGIKEDKIRVIPNAFEEQNFELSREEARKELNLSGVIAVSVGRLVPWKGFEALIEIAKEIKSQVPDFRLFIIGSGPKEIQLKKLIKNLNLEDVVFLTGSKSKTETFKYLKAADLFILNTAYEGLSHALLEALAAGTSVITTDVGGNPEIIIHEKNGILVEYNDKTALKNRILELINTPEKRRFLSENGKESLKKFNKETMLKETIKLLI